MRTVRSALAAALLVACTFPSVAQAAVPAPVLAVQGSLRSGNGLVVPDGDYAMSVAVYDAVQGGTALHEETFIAIAVQSGLFAVELGAKKAKIADKIFDGSERWIGITVGSNPELPRVAIRDTPLAIHARFAGSAAGLQCSGCIVTDHVADGAVTGAKLATGAVDAKHVAFSYAGSDSKGGSAVHAKFADGAKTADVAKSADKAVSADEAAFAKAAGKLQCTGCVGIDQIHAGLVADLVAKKQLAVVAVSGKYADLQGGPDLSGLAQLAKPNTWTAAQAFDGGVSFGGAVQFAQQQAQLFRFQNADKHPVVCDPKAAGMVYFNHVSLDLYLCTGKQWQTFARFGVGSAQDNPAKSCKALLAADASTPDGVYWLDGDGSGSEPPFQGLCDMKTDGGGWTLVARAKGAATSGWGTTGDLNPSAGTAVGGTFKWSDGKINALVTDRYRMTYDGSVLGSAGQGQDAWWYWNASGCVYGHTKKADGNCDKAFGNVALTAGPIPGTNGNATYMGLDAGGPNYIHTHHSGPTWYVRAHHTYQPGAGSAACDGSQVGCDIALWVR